MITIILFINVNFAINIIVGNIQKLSNFQSRSSLIVKWSNPPYWELRFKIVGSIPGHVSNFRPLIGEKNQ